MKRLILILTVLALAGCAAAPRVPTGIDAEQLWQARFAALASLQTWTFSGRVAVQSGDDGWHATLHWRQHPDSYDIRIVAPLGQGAAWLHGDAQAVRLRTAQAEEFVAADPEALLYERLGWRVPVSGLRYWVRGLPDASAAAEKTLDEAGRIAHLRQAGWEIDFTRYREVEGVQLPDRITLDSPRLKVRLVIDQWVLSDGAPEAGAAPAGAG